jgi:hypothetical protein
MTVSANGNAPAQAFDMRPGDEGRTVYDIATGEPARVSDMPQTGLDMEMADDLVDLLNFLARQKH